MLRGFALTCFGFLLFSSIAVAQQERPPRPTRPSKIRIVPSVQNEVYVPYWTLEPGWHTGIELRNNLSTSDLTVTTSLRTSTGNEIALSPITVKPNEVTVVDLHAELMKAAPQLMDKTGAVGSAVLRYTSPFVHNLYAGSMVHLEGKPIAYHFDAMESDPTFDGDTSREGIWWLPTAGTEGHLIVTNASSKPSISTLTLFASSGRSIQKPIALGPRQMRRFSMRDLVTEAGFSETSGGLRIQVEKGSESIYAAQVAFDEATGFSALLRMFERNPAEKAGRITLRAPMMALSTPDPALMMPPETLLRPQVFLRNAAPESVKVSATLRWRDGANSGKEDLGTFELAAGATKTLEIYKLQENGKVPKGASWGTVYAEYQGRYGDLVAIAASYEAAGKYGLQTPFNDLMASRWVGSKWFADTLHSSIITVGNGSESPTTANLTLHYNQGKDLYEVEQKLAPGEQIWLDVQKIIRNQTPDKKGRTIPQGIEFGSYSVKDMDRVVGATLFEGKLTIDKKFGHASYGCGFCCDCSYPWMDPNPFGAPTGGGWFNTVWGNEPCSGNLCNLNDMAYSWNSSNSSVASVDSVGYGQGVSPGTSDITAFLYIPSTTWKCPYRQRQIDTTGTVRPTVSISGPTRVPLLLSGVQGPDSIQLTATPNPGGGTFSWSAISGGASVNVLNETSQTATIQSVSPGTATIQVTYTKNGQSSSASQLTRVQLPARLGITSDTGSLQDFFCGGVPYSCGVRRARGYQVQEGDGTPITASMPIYETFSSVSNSCSDLPNVPAATSGTTDASGNFPDVDTLAMKSGVCLPADANGIPQGSCSLVVDQSWFANGYRAGYQRIEYACKTITLVPLQ